MVKIQMKSEMITIKNAAGLHARPASVFVRQASAFKSEIRLIKNNTIVNGKSIMGVLMLALASGNTVKLETEGVDESEAIEKLSAILSGDFSE